MKYGNLSTVRIYQSESDLEIFFFRCFIELNPKFSALFFDTLQNRCIAAAHICIKWSQRKLSGDVDVERNIGEKCFQKEEIWKEPNYATIFLLAVLHSRLCLYIKKFVLEKVCINSWSAITEKHTICELVVKNAWYSGSDKIAISITTFDIII